jgi:hypothetical protein
LVSRRYERGSIIITSNRGFEQWGEILGDAMVAASLIDRLVHHATMITLKGKSYRLRERGLDVAPASPNRTRIASEGQRSAKPTPQEGRSRPPSTQPYLRPGCEWCTFRLRKLVHFSAALDRGSSPKTWSCTHHKLTTRPSQRGP